jgi:hypothetical protein
MVCAGRCHVPLKSHLPGRDIKGSLIRTSLFLRFTTMVSIGLTDAHVQPVLEKIPATSFLAASY